METLRTLLRMNTERFCYKAANLQQNTVQTPPPPFSLQHNIVLSVFIHCDFWFFFSSSDPLLTKSCNNGPINCALVCLSSFNKFASNFILKFIKNLKLYLSIGLNQRISGALNEDQQTLQTIIVAKNVPDYLSAQKCSGQTTYRNKNVPYYLSE
jgi:hypothetical protein